MPPVGDHSKTATYALAPNMGTTIVFNVSSKRTGQYHATKRGYLFTSSRRLLLDKFLYSSMPST